MTVKNTCVICHEEVVGAASVHPQCAIEHPEFTQTPAPKKELTGAPDEWCAQFEKEFGKGVMRRGNELESVTYRSSGSIALDVALGGGWARGRVVDVVGKEGHGKTLVCEMAAVTAQREEGLRTVLFDFEGTFDPLRFAALGGDLTLLDVIRAENVSDRAAPLFFGETAFDMAKTLLRFSEKHAVLIFDSTGAMVSKAEYDKKDEDGMEKATMTHTARVMSDGLRLIVGSGMLARTSMSLFFVSQLRDPVGARPIGRGIPIPDRMTGGRALRFYASQRVEVSKGAVIKADVEDTATGRNDSNIEIGHGTNVRVRKNKCNRVQGRVAQFDIYTDGAIKGLDRSKELFDLGIYAGVIVRSGSSYKVFDRTVKGKDAVIDLLRFPEAFENVYLKTRERLQQMMDDNAQPETPEEEEALDAQLNETERGASAEA